MVHLHTRSCYSLLESSNRISQIIDRSIHLGFRHVCLTDKNVMYGTMEFIQECHQKNIHPIVGLELTTLLDDQDFDFICLAKNDRGLQALFQISSWINTHEETIPFSVLIEMIHDCFVLTSGDQDMFDQYCAHEQVEEMMNILTIFKQSFPDFYVSIAMNDSSFRKEKNKVLKKVAHSLEIKTVALSRIYYEKKEDVQSLRILRAIAKQTTINDQTLDVMNDRYFRSNEEMEQLYDEDDLKETEIIASACNIQMAFEKNSLPTFHNKLGIDSKSYLIKLCKVGLMKRLQNHVPIEYQKRLEYELSVITSMGFTDYFLIVWDFIRYAKSQDIHVGCGRGSAAGSLVAYCLGITHVDPVKHHLLFERFLNPGRITMPDIDTDFPDNRRDEVIEYVKEKYGQDHVSHIIAFNTLQPKQVLRDVARVINYPIRKVDALTKAIGNATKITLIQALEEIPAFAKLVYQDQETRQLFDLCLPLEGLPRHLTLHAAGIVIAKDPITKVCPLVNVDDEHVATQFTKDYLEELGLIKMDFLSIRNLTTIYSIVDTLKEKEHIDLDILKLPLNDSRTFQLLARGDTIGIFQLESQGIKKLLQEMKPNKFEDICAVLALYRPGPMKNISLYIERKNDPTKIEYPDPRLKPILQETYGIMVYQEQIMQCATVIGGFTLTEADDLRKAMSSKDKTKMKAYQERFLKGAVQNHCTLKKAQEIFDTMEKFAEYGFNRSHSYVYAMTSYQMAYLKANYPLYFYQRLLDSVIGSDTKTSQYIYECQHRDLQILPVDIHNSTDHYEIEGKALRMPLQILKGIGKSIYPSILEERKKGPFTDLISCIVRLTANKVSESSLRILIDGGAFDAFGYSRMTVHENLSMILNYANIVITENANETLFEWDVVSPPRMTKMKEDPLLKSKREYQVLGFYISEHPVMMLRKQYPQCALIQDIQDYIGYVQVIGRVVSFKSHKTKKGDWMCFMTIEDEHDKIDIAIMPNLYAVCKEKIIKDSFVYVQGKKDRPQSILAQKMDFIELP